MSFQGHEVKDNVVKHPPTKIVEAYGLLKCPRLIDQVAENDLEVRVNALAVLCDEFRNPYVIQGCCKAGAVPLLAAMVTDPDYLTRVRSSKVLSIAASDSIGITSILEHNAVPDILSGMNDEDNNVRCNVYTTLLHLTSTQAGIHSCVNSNVTAALAGTLLTEHDDLKPLILDTLHNLSKSEQGLTNALEAECIQKFHTLLQSKNRVVVDHTAKALAFMCFDDSAKMTAIGQNTVELLLQLLGVCNDPCRISLTTAIMVISSTDEAKRRIHDCDGIEVLLSCIQNNNKIVQLNILKILSNISVHPKIREVLSKHDLCVPYLKDLQEKCTDALIVKHCKLTLQAVLWSA